MNKFVCLFALFALAAAQVLELDSSNFDSAIAGKNAFVEFYAPWCGHCKNLAPAYDVVGESFSKEKGVVIAKVDADKHKELGGRFDVHGFPTLKYFPQGSSTPENYEGGRTAEDIINFINSKAGTNVKVKKAPSAVVDLDSSNFNKIVLDTSKDVLAEFYAPWCGHCKKLAPDYEKVGSAFASEQNVVVAKLDADAHKEFASKYGVTGFPTILWFGKNNKENPERYEKPRDVDSFISYINEKAGTKRLANGKLQSGAGRIAALDTLASQFLASSDKAGLLQQAQTAVSSLSGDDAKNSKFYIKAMEAIQTKGAEYVDSEIARLGKLLEGSVAAAKADEFTIRQNILNAFKN